MLFARAYAVSFFVIILIMNSLESSVAQMTYIGEIRMFAGDYAPNGWHLCDGSAISRAEYDILFNEIGTTYGAGDGVTTFNVPDLRGRAPVHYIPGDPNYQPGQQGGVETVTLGQNQIPSHIHSLNVQSHFATHNSPKSSVLAVPFLTTNYCPSETPRVAGSSETLSSAGGNQAHSNMQPYMAVNYIIAIYGIPLPAPTSSPTPSA